MKRLRSFLSVHWPPTILVITGVGSVGTGLLQDRGELAVPLTGLGVLCLVASAFASRLTNLEIGPGGLKGSLAPAQQDADESTGFLTGPEYLPSPTDSLEERELVVAARTALAGEAISFLLDTSFGPLAGCLLRLYLLDLDAQLLVPVVRSGDPSPSPLESFRPGCGATGTAWARGEFVFVHGSAVTDATYGLSPEQQEYFRSLTAVASLPVLDASDQVIGVLTVSTEERDGPDQLASEDAYYDLLGRSFLMARVLVDLLHWFTDD